MLYGIFNKIEVEKSLQKTKGQSKKITEIGKILLDKTESGVDYLVIPLQSAEATFSLISEKHIATFELDEVLMKTWKSIHLPLLQYFEKVSSFFLSAEIEFEGLIDEFNSFPAVDDLDIDISDIGFDYQHYLYNCDFVKKNTIAELRKIYNFQFS